MLTDYGFIMAHAHNNYLSASQIAVLSKAEVIKRLVHFEGRFVLDYSSDYLEKLSVDRLRHILFAAILINEGPGKLRS